MYENNIIDESLPSYSSGIADFTKQQRFSVLTALGELGVVATTEDANTQNGEKVSSFYDDYLNGKPVGKHVTLCYDGDILTINY